MLKRRKMIAMLMAVGLGMAATCSAAAPSILMRSSEEFVGGSGRLSSIAVDTMDQPHLVCDGGSMAYLYDKVGGGWQASSLNVKSFGYNQYNNPHLEIDSKNRGWCSGIIVAGFGVIMRENMAITPTAPRFSEVKIRENSWDSGNLSIDPVYPEEAVLMAAYGNWKKIIYSASSSSRIVEGISGVMFAGMDGEKKGFWIDKKGGAIAHANGTSHSVWHNAICGYTGDWPNQYQNSIRSAQGLPQVTWARYNSKTYTMEDDGTYPDCVSDNKDPQRAYMVTDFSVGQRFSGTAGVAMNLWTGSAMKFNADTLLTIDANGTSGLRRYSPQLAAAKDGGAYVTWIRGGRVKVMYISPEGEKGDEWDVAAGNWSDICTDSKGNLHIVYNNGGIRYQKWTMSGSVSASSLPGDFDSDGNDDLAVFDPATAKWYIQTVATASNILWGRTFGFVGGTPIVGDFNGDFVSDIGVFDPVSNRWTAQSIATMATIVDVQFGQAGTIPVVGDFNGDNTTDIGVWNPVDGKWYATNVFGTTLSLDGQKWGASGMVPVPMDYDGDGKCDLGIYDPATAKWYIQSITNLSGVFVNGKVVGLPGSIPVPADYNNDGAADLAVVNPSTFYWFSQNANSALDVSTVRQWGFAGSRPVVGDFNGDGNTDIGVWSPTDGRWYIRASNPATTKSSALSWGFNGASMCIDKDFNNDAHADFSVYYNGRWYIRNTTIIAYDRQWGFPGGAAVPGDFDGDGSADLGVFDTASSKWYIQTMATSNIAWQRSWGYAGTTPLAVDFSGDGAKDLVAYDSRNGNWFGQTLGGSVVAWYQNWGFPGAIPLPGDYNNDGVEDLAVYNPNSGQWFVRTLNNTVLAWSRQWGFPGATPVAGDFNGDGKNDLAVFAAGKWYIQSLDGTVIKWEHPWGVQGGVPFTGDMNGDGATDLGVFDITTGYWYVQSLQDSFTTILFGRQLGTPSMMPIGSPAN